MKKLRKFPKNYMKRRKKEKRKKIRQTPIDEKVLEQKFNNAEMEL